MKRMMIATGALALALLLVTWSAPAAAQDAKMLDKVMAALPEKAPVKPKAPHKILIFSRTAGFRHSSIPVGAKAIAMMGDKTGAYTAFHTEDESFFEPEKLAKFDAVFMLNTTGNCFFPKEGTKEERSKREEMLKKACRTSSPRARDWSASTPRRTPTAAGRNTTR